MIPRNAHALVSGAALLAAAAFAVAEPTRATAFIDIPPTEAHRFVPSLEPRRAHEPANHDELGRALGRFELTYYWIAEQRAADGPRVLRDPRCRPVARVRASFAQRLTREGTGRLLDGRLLNVTSRCQCGTVCYVVATEAGNGWGLGVANRPLSPFRSIAVDPGKVDIGQWVYVAELDGVWVPGSAPWGGYVHDGCLLADDRGGGVRGAQIDFFAGLRRYYRDVHSVLRTRAVTVRDGGTHCQRHASSEA